MNKTVYCGLLRREPDGRWFYGEQLIGIDGEPVSGALKDALADVADAPEPVLAEPTTPAIQTSFSWPVDEPIIAVDESETLAEAHRQVWANLDAGTWCPCCRRNARRYARPLHAEMATFLVNLVRAFEKQKRYYHNREILPGADSSKSSTDGSYLTVWGLVKRKPGATGWYLPEPAGIALVRGRIEVPKYAWIYDGRATHFSAERITIREALQNKLSVLSMLTDREGPGVSR